MWRWGKVVDDRPLFGCSTFTTVLSTKQKRFYIQNTITNLCLHKDSTVITRPVRYLTQLTNEFNPYSALQTC